MRFLNSGNVSSSGSKLLTERFDSILRLCHVPPSLLVIRVRHRLPSSSPPVSSSPLTYFDSRSRLSLCLLSPDVLSALHRCVAMMLPSVCPSLSPDFSLIGPPCPLPSSCVSCNLTYKAFFLRALSFRPKMYVVYSSPELSDFSEHRSLDLRPPLDVGFLSWSFLNALPSPIM